MARRYSRDSRGRFSGGGASSSRSGSASRAAKPKVTGGTLNARSSLRRSTAKLAANASPAQRGAVTRAKNTLQATKQASRQRLGSGQAHGTLRPGQRKQSAEPAAPASKAANGIRSTGRSQPRNNVRPYRPKTVGGKLGQIDRQIDRTMKPAIDELRELSERAKKAKPEIDRQGRRLERMNAQAIANRRKKGIDGELAGVELNIMGGRSGAKAIQRRMQRAADAAARGSKPAARARVIYGNQLAAMGPGKPRKGAKNNLRPGPSNTKGTPKRRRKPKG